jgi:hypothetical protein
MARTASEGMITPSGIMLLMCNEKFIRSVHKNTA